MGHASKKINPPQLDTEIIRLSSPPKSAYRSMRIRWASKPDPSRLALSIALSLPKTISGMTGGWAYG